MIYYENNNKDGYDKTKNLSKEFIMKIFNLEILRKQTWNHYHNDLVKEIENQFQQYYEEILNTSEYLEDFESQCFPIEKALDHINFETQFSNSNTNNNINNMDVNKFTQERKQIIIEDLNRINKQKYDEIHIKAEKSKLILKSILKAFNIDFDTKITGIINSEIDCKNYRDDIDKEKGTELSLRKSITPSQDLLSQIKPSKRLIFKNLYEEKIEYAKKRFAEQYNQKITWNQEFQKKKNMAIDILEKFLKETKKQMNCQEDFHLFHISKDTLIERIKNSENFYENITENKKREINNYVKKISDDYYFTFLLEARKMPTWDKLLDQSSKIFYETCETYVNHKLNSFSHQELSQCYRPRIRFLMDKINSKGPFYTGICEERKKQIEKAKLSAIYSSIDNFDRQAKEKPKLEDIFRKIYQDMKNASTNYINDILRNYHYFEDLSEHEPTIELIKEEIQRKINLQDYFNNKSRPNIYIESQFYRSLEKAAKESIQDFNKKKSKRPKWIDELTNFQINGYQIALKYINKIFSSFYYREEIEAHKPANEDIIKYIQNQEELFINIIESRRNELKKEIEIIANKVIEDFNVKLNKKERYADAKEEFLKKIHETSTNCVEEKLEEFQYSEELKNHMLSQKMIIEEIKKREDLYINIIESRRDDLEQEIIGEAKVAFEYFIEKANSKPKWVDAKKRFLERIEETSMNCARKKLAELNLENINLNILKLHEPTIEMIKSEINARIDLYNGITEEKKPQLQNEIEWAAKNANTHYWKEGMKRLPELNSLSCCIA